MNNIITLIKDIQAILNTTITLPITVISFIFFLKDRKKKFKEEVKQQTKPKKKQRTHAKKHKPKRK